MAIKSPQRNGAIRSFIRKIRFRLATEVRAKNPLPCRSSVVPGKRHHGRRDRFCRRVDCGAPLLTFPQG
jgi:hypothetical protein